VRPAVVAVSSSMKGGAAAAARLRVLALGPFRAGGLSRGVCSMMMSGQEKMRSGEDQE
jgi:hypothetical protein